MAEEQLQFGSNQMHAVEINLITLAKRVAAEINIFLIFFLSIVRKERYTKKYRRFTETISIYRNI